MAYFNNAYNRVFLGTSVNSQGNTNLSDGLLITAGFPTVKLTQTGQSSADENYGPGTFGFFDPETWTSIDPTLAAYNGCCPLILAAASIQQSDKIGPFAGGYQETNKSKIINPKFVQKIYKVEPCTPTQAVTSIGVTPNPDTASCQFDFLCQETYYLRLDLKGSPALRFLNHNAYQNIFAYTGCCEPNPAGTVVDPVLVYIEFATQIVNNPYVSPFVKPVVYDNNGNPWYHTAADAVAAGNPATQIWTNYVSPAAPYTGNSAGMRLFGAYVDTVFGDCSFQVSDFFQKESITIHASLVDMNGDPCTFEGLCVNNDCLPVQGMGFGEQVLRDVILSESYLQNFFATDIRIREITQGSQYLGVNPAGIERSHLYTRYYILHNVPRYQNPTGVFDNDRYLLEIITYQPNTVLETFLANWSASCIGCATPEEFSCTPCTPVADPIVP